ncbi:MAG: hypothetical protein ACO3SP_08580, partial [Ilumatobacteraceae bacterium]
RDGCLVDSCLIDQPRFGRVTTPPLLSTNKCSSFPNSSFHEPIAARTASYFRNFGSRYADGGVL